MLNIILNIVGITLVLYSIFIIKKDISIKKSKKNQIINSEFIEDEIYNEEYYQIDKKMDNNFDSIISNKIKVSDSKTEEIKNEVKFYETYKKTTPIVKDNRLNSGVNKINPLHKKVIELESLGLTNEEIAKNMGKGIREIDIILKIYKK